MAKRTPGFFNFDERLSELSANGDDLERVNGLEPPCVCRRAIYKAEKNIGPGRVAHAFKNIPWFSFRRE